MYRNIKFFIFFLAAACFWGSGYAQAAEVFLELSSFFANGQKSYEVKFFLNTDGESINAIEGELDYSGEDLAFQKIIDGSSIVSFWLKSPQKSNDEKIIFSGGMPGGYRGEKGFLFSAVFNAAGDLSESHVEISLTNLKVYLNDGNGTRKDLQDYKNTLDLTGAVSEEVVFDKKPPEVFAPYVTRDPNLADGQWVAILNAQDKGDGIDHYEIFESAEKYKPEEIVNNNFLPWQLVENPRAYVLYDQSLGNYVYAKAIDKAGNEKVAIVIPAITKKLPHFDYKIISGIIILLITALIVFLELFFFRERKYE